MKILVISYHYPPDPAVGGLRAENVANSLRQAGHDVHVIAAGNSAVQNDIDRVAPLPSVASIYAALRRILARLRHLFGKEAGERDTSRKPKATATIPFWKRWIYSFIWLPDDKQGFVLPALLRAIRQPGEKPNIVYTTAPPYSVHLVGLFFRVLTGARWVAEFRDPWTSNPWKPAEFKSALSTWLNCFLERTCAESADLLVAVSDGINDRLEATGTTTPMITIRNGISNLSPAPDVVEESRCRDAFEIVYAGTFYHARDPFPFLEAIKSLASTHTREPSRLRLRLIGASDTYNGSSVREFIRANGLESHVSLESWMDPDACLRCMREADALLLLALDQPDQVPNKLYDYLGTRRPILAVADQDGESARMLQEAGGHIVVPVNEEEPIRAAIEVLMKNGPCGPVGDEQLLRRWRTSVQMRRLCESLEDLDT